MKDGSKQSLFQTFHQIRYYVVLDNNTQLNPAPT